MRQHLILTSNIDAESSNFMDGTKKKSTLWPGVAIQKFERITSRKITKMQISQEPLQIWKI